MANDWRSKCKGHTRAAHMAREVMRRMRISIGFEESRMPDMNEPEEG